MPGPPFPVVLRANWTGGSITQNVDGWEIGTYRYACTVYDTQGSNVSSEVTVTVIQDYSPIIIAVGVVLAVVGVIGVIAYFKKTRLS